MSIYSIPSNTLPVILRVHASGHRTWRSRLTALAIVVSLSMWLTAWAAGTAALVKDINVASFQAGLFTQELQDLTNVNGKLFFIAWDEINGMELWKSDGTTLGTTLVKEFLPGSQKSYLLSAYLTNVNGTLFFSADDRSAGQELWKSNGTSAGTVLVKDIVPGSLGSQPTALTNVNGALFFSARSDSNRRQLWKSDGTAVGTVLIKDGFSGQDDVYGQSAPFALINVDGTLFFTNASSSGTELWRSDGTEAGTILLKVTFPGNYNSATMGGLTAVNRTLFFTASEDHYAQSGLWKSDGTPAGTVLVRIVSADKLTTTHGLLFYINETPGLWKSDGTTAGTVLVKDFSSRGDGITLSGLSDVNGTLFFYATTNSNGVELWKTDGTTAGTALIKKITPSWASVESQTAVNRTLFFSLYDGKAQLWKSDGTTAGTVRVDLSLEAGSIAPQSLTSVNGIVFYFTGWFDSGFTLWKSDGTTAGTVPAKSPVVAQGSSDPANFTAINGTLFFTADDGINGEELWKSDATTGGTILVKDIYAGPKGSSPRDLINLNGTLLFTAEDGNYMRKLWKSDGTAAGTTPVKDVTPCILLDPQTPRFVKVGGTLFFCAYDGQIGNELWKSNGTVAGTLLVKDINPGSSFADPFGMTDVDGTLFFGANDGTGVALWKSDGTPDGTQRIQAISSMGDPDARLSGLNVHGTLFFRQVAANNARELWRSDGTAAGTVLIKRFGSVQCWRIGCSSDSVAQLTDVSGRLFFAARETGTSNALWTSDGTPQGTVKLTDATPAQLTDLNGMLIFIGYNSQTGAELWKSDGTAAGTTLVNDILPGAVGSMPTNLTIMDGTLFFTANDGVSGTELWKSNGTTAGTVQVKDSVLGFGGAVPTGLVNASATLVFSAWDMSTGVEPWMSDGTAAGTMRIQDIAPGSTSSNPSQFYVSDTTLFFIANDGGTGQELWMLPLAAIHPVAATIAPDGGQLVSLLDGTSYIFPAGTFTAPTTVTHRVRAPDSLPTVGALVSINHAFEVTAVDSVTGQLVQPARPYTLTVPYTEAERGSAIESTLALYCWDGGQWVREPSSVIDAASKVITATPNHFSLWAVLGETHHAFLPAVL